MEHMTVLRSELLGMMEWPRKTPSSLVPNPLMAWRDYEFVTRHKEPALSIHCAERIFRTKSIQIQAYELVRRWSYKRSYQPPTLLSCG